MSWDDQEKISISIEMYVSSPIMVKVIPVTTNATIPPANLKKKTVPFISFLRSGCLTISLVEIDSSPSELKDAKSQAKLKT